MLQVLTGFSHHFVTLNCKFYKSQNKNQNTAKHAVHRHRKGKFNTVLTFRCFSQHHQRMNVSYKDKVNYNSGYITEVVFQAI